MMHRQKLILIGGGGHCKACIDVIEQTERYEILGILDVPSSVGSFVLGYKVIGTDSDIAKYAIPDVQFLITIGQIKSPLLRMKVAGILDKNNAELATIISPHAYVSKHAELGAGTIVMHHAIVNAAVATGRNCILNTKCTIEHDTLIGNYSHISTNAVINGCCKIGDQVFVGSNATVSNQVTIGDSIVIGAGTVVNRDTEERGIYIGNPIKKISK